MDLYASVNESSIFASFIDKWHTVFTCNYNTTIHETEYNDESKILAFKKKIFIGTSSNISGFPNVEDFHTQKYI